MNPLTNRLLAVLSCLFVGVACGRERADQPPPPPDLSIHQLDHTFTDQTGQRRRLDAERGKPVLMAMMFTHCSYACPALVADIGRVVAAAGSPPDLRVVLVTMDHERDVPEVLATFAARHDLDPSRWSLLHGDADAVAELAAVLGVRYARVEGGDFSHSNRITLLDRSGAINHVHDGLGEDSRDLVAAVRAQFAK